MEIQSSRGVVVKKFGGYEGITVEKFPLPDLRGKIEVRVLYGGLNFVDFYARQGFATNRLPFVLGIECAGTIQAIGDGVTNTNLKIGQKVVCYDYHGGMYSDVIRVDPSSCFPLPQNIDCKTGAATFVSYLTAYFAVIEMGNLKDNETILILSCTGGVGTAAIQLARTRNNVKVYGTGSENKRIGASKHGVDVFLTNQFLENEVKNHKYDLILTNRAGTMFSILQNQLNPLGRIILIGASDMVKNETKINALATLKTWWLTKYIPPHELINNCKQVGGLHLGKLVNHDRGKTERILEHIYSLIKNEKLNPVIDSVWPLPKIIDATKQLAERKNVGKVLICMEDDLTLGLEELVDEVL